MKNVLLLVFFLVACVTSVMSQKLDSLKVTSNGVTYVVKKGDVVHLGYGKNPYGSFQFIEIGSPPSGMEKEGGGRNGEVTYLRYWKMGDTYEMGIKVKGMGMYAVTMPQAVEVGEITGFNDIYFKKE